MIPKENHDYDVLVAGGGFAGIAAALAAARGGRRVALFERQFILGGLGTSGLVTVYLPLCDGCGRQVSFGIAEELFRLSIKYGAEGRYPANWLDGVGTRTDKDPRFMVDYNPHLFAILAERLLTEEGVDIFYGSLVCDATVEDGRITSLHIENKSGRTAYYAGSVIDATGDCDVAHFAGAPTETFGPGNVLAAWYYFTDSEGYKLKQYGAADILGDGNETKKEEALVKRRFSGLDAKEISEMTYLSHEKILDDWLKRRKTEKNITLSTIATIPQLRMTRRIVGEATLTLNDDHKYFEDSVGMVSNWRKRGPVYEIPFGTLYNKCIKNLLVAGRIISSDDPMWDIMRVIPCCAVTGEAVGTAAALSDDFTTISVTALQNKLKENGIKLHIKELEK